MPVLGCHDPVRNHGFLRIEVAVIDNLAIVVHHVGVDAALDDERGR